MVAITERIAAQLAEQPPDDHPEITTQQRARELLFQGTVPFWRWTSATRHRSALVECAINARRSGCQNTLAGVETLRVGRSGVKASIPRQASVRIEALTYTIADIGALRSGAVGSGRDDRWVVRARA